MLQGRVQRGTADIVEIEIHSLRAGAGDGGGQVLPGLVVDDGVGAQLARDKSAFPGPARDSRYPAAFYAGDLYRDLAHAARRGGDQHAVVRPHAADVAHAEIGRDGAETERAYPILDGAETEIELLQVTARNR